ncbi:hypothetical protein B398_02655 [Xylella fastidiosa 32]|nr:hypothetical protein B398_02655 [Xylella fastidiosa 32]
MEMVGVVLGLVLKFFAAVMRCYPLIEELKQ